MQNNKTKRLEYIDATKGVAILCITFLHFEKGVIPEWLNEWIGSFMVSTFYFTSGWITGINNKPIKPNELLKKRIKQLGVPYFWFSLLIIAFDFIWALAEFMDTGILLRDIYKTFTLRGIGTLWFLPVLIFGEYLFCIIKNSKKPAICGILMVLSSVLILYVYNYIWAPLLKLNDIYKLIDSPIRPFVTSLFACPIIILGYISAQRWGNQILETNRTKLFVTAATIFTVGILLSINPLFNIYYINCITAIAFMCIFLIFTRNVITRFFYYWGRNSLILMCTHFSITMEILMAFDKYVLHHPVFEGPVTILYFAVCILLTYPLVNLFNGKLKFIIGK